MYISRTVVKARKGLVALKTMAATRMSQKIIVILYQALILLVINHGFCLMALSAAKLKILEGIENETMRTILCCTKATSTEAMRYLLVFPTIAERHKLAQVKAFLRVMADKTHLMHRKVGQRPLSRLKRGSELMTYVI